MLQLQQAVISSVINGYSAKLPDSNICVKPKYGLNVVKYYLYFSVQNSFTEIHRHVGVPTRAGIVLKRKRTVLCSILSVLLAEDAVARSPMARASSCGKTCR